MGDPESHELLRGDSLPHAKVASQDQDVKTFGQVLFVHVNIIKTILLEFLIKTHCNFSLFLSSRSESVNFPLDSLAF